MTDEELFVYLSGMYAYDTGCVSSGIKDEIKRQEIIKLLRSDYDLANKKLANFVLIHFLSEKASQQGYGLEDVRSFITWLGDYMEFDV